MSMQIEYWHTTRSPGVSYHSSPIFSLIFTIPAGGNAAPEKGIRIVTFKAKAIMNKITFLIIHQKQYKYNIIFALSLLNYLT